MKKNILVSVDSGETRVAVLEAKGSPKEGKRPKKAAPTNEWKVAELYVERRGRAAYLVVTPPRRVRSSEYTASLAVR